VSGAGRRSEQVTPLSAARRRRILVAGDVTINWNIARLSNTPAKGYIWTIDEKAAIDGEWGGAVHLASLLKEVAKFPTPESPAFDVVSYGLPESMPAAHHAPDRHHSYRVWRQYPRESGSSEKVWRVEEFLGFNPASKAHRHTTDAADISDFDLVVIADTSLGFRTDPRYWPEGIERPAKGPSPWILLKMGAAVAQGPLWNKLIENHADRLIVIITLNELRDSGVAISRELSWEKTATDLINVLERRPEARALTKCANVIVSFMTGGAILLSRDQKDRTGSKLPKCRAIFDPSAIENSWVESYEGGMAGFATCLTAAVARELILEPTEPDLEQSICRGIAAGRALHVDGYDYTSKGSDPAKLQLPVARIAAKLASYTPGVFSAATIDHATEGWSILESVSREQPLAELVARNGKKIFTNVPYASFGDYLTVDRGEIEGFRSIRNLIREYDAQSVTRPLSIAVFGPPGSGKSFGVKAVAKAALPNGRIEVLSFNISQMQSPGELSEALHQVRDAGLRGKLPFACWDEFDADLGSAPLGWLRYFLAPMQDGEFNVAQVAHPIGKAIFVFAGGTRTSFAKFGHSEKEADEEAYSRIFRQAKGPDFVSRLKGYVDIVGPDPRGADIASDPWFGLRRAILLRSMLEYNRPALFDEHGRLNIDTGVLRAFLDVKKFSHGARSIESIIWMSTLHGKSTYDRSDLPAREQLSAHVDAKEFLDIVEKYARVEGTDRNVSAKARRRRRAPGDRG
jgi:hypothetical protein